MKPDESIRQLKATLSAVGTITQSAANYLDVFIEYVIQLEKEYNKILLENKTLKEEKPTDGNIPKELSGTDVLG